MQPENTPNETDTKAAMELKNAITKDCRAINDHFIKISDGDKAHDYMAIIYHNKAVVRAASDSDDETFALADKLQETTLPILKRVSDMMKQHLGKRENFVVVVDHAGAGLYSTKSGKPLTFEGAIEAHTQSTEQRSESPLEKSFMEQLLGVMLKKVGENSPMGKDIRKALDEIANDKDEECDCPKCQAEKQTQLASDRVKPSGDFFPN